MAEAVYVLCGILSVCCAGLLLRGYMRAPSALLLWSSFCFILLAINSGVLVLDLVIYPNTEINGFFWRNLLGASAGSVLLFGLIWEMT
jgi:hypothetical protein